MRLLVCTVLLSLIACTDNAEPPLLATAVVISRPMPGNHTSAGYLSFTNNSADVIRISRVESTEFGAVEIHESLLTEGVAKMRRVEELLIPARTTVALQPGGKHLMLMRPHGTPDSVSLRFYSDDSLLLSVQVSITRNN